MAFDLQPDLKGELIELRPLKPNDWNELFAVASDSLIWEQHPEPDRYQGRCLQNFLQRSTGIRRPVRHHRSEDSTNHRVDTVYGYNPEKSEIEIGWTFLARKYWGGRHNAEMKQLLLDHAFKFVESVVFFVGEDNVRSQKAMEKVGAIKLGTATRAYGNHPFATNLKYMISKT